MYAKLSTLEPIESAIRDLKSKQALFQDVTTLPLGILELKKIVSLDKELAKSASQTTEDSAAYKATLKNVLLSLIDSIDLSIKVMKSSPIEPLEERMKWFQELLIIYKDLHNSIIRDELGYDAYCDEFDSLFDSKLTDAITQDELIPSGKLSPAASSFHAG